jgi:DNA-binding response OmpR family regulator
VAFLDVLIVEDDALQRESLARHLSAQDWTIRTASDGVDALVQCEKRRPDIVVLDIRLPGRSGIEVCAALRANYQDALGVVMVTGCDTELDVMMGFEVGADDYIIKPFRLREIIARVKALGRRLRRDVGPGPKPAGGQEVPGEVLVRGPLRIEVETRRVTVHDKPIRLTGTEFALLIFMARWPDRIFSRLQLLENVWDSDYEGYQRNVDCHVTRVRKKLEVAGYDPSPIESIYGVGYRFVVPGPSESAAEAVNSVAGRAGRAQR